jgi:quercetin dioxygenase-like cupin family protein
MLGQIETGKSVPTITVLWKVAEALGVPVALLIADPDAPRFVVSRKSSARVAAASAGGFETRPIAPSDDPSELNFEEVRIAPGHRERIPAQRAAARVSLVVARGALEVTVGNEVPVDLAEGDAVFFSATSEHVLANLGPDESILYLVVAPQRMGHRTGRF